MFKGLEHLTNHVSLNSNVDILQMCKFFFANKPIKINHVNYIQRNDDGTVLYLCSNQSWLMHYFKMGYPSVGAFEQKAFLSEFKYVLWDSLDKRDQILIDSVEMLKIEQGITIIDKLPDGVGFYNFGTNQHSHLLLSAYLNHLEDLKAFIVYFKERALDLLAKAHKHRFILPNNSSEKKLLLYSDFKKAEDLQSLITPRQRDCLRDLARGMTAKQIANSLNLSHRTVESYLNTLKERLNCSNRFELINKALQMKDIKERL